ncbi:MAG: hypothetical protein ACRD9Y_18930 [Blastocatellia bacterium]
MAAFKFMTKRTRLMSRAITLSLLALGGFSQSSIADRTEAAQARVLRVVSASGMAGGSVAVTVELVAQGNENAIGFSLSFNTAQLTNPQTAAGSGAGGASLNVNALQAAQGRLGVAMAQPSGQTFVAGTRQLVVVTFSIPANAGAGTAQINFGDQPITREIVDVNANPLQTGYTGGAVTITAQTPVTSVSAASFSGAELAAESIAAAFGAGLATSTQVATTVPLPTTLAGTTVRVRDSAGTTRDAPLFFVAPQQINYLIPAGASAGAAIVTVTSGSGAVSTGTAQIATVAPGLFTANASGQGVAAAVALRVKPDGTRTNEPVAEFNQAQNRFIAKPIDLGPDGELVFLILFGTGFRNRSSLSAVSASVGGAPVESLFAGAQGDFVGLDQANIGPLPRSLAGRGEVDLVFRVDNKAANMARISVK